MDQHEPSGGKAPADREVEVRGAEGLPPFRLQRYDHLRLVACHRYCICVMCTESTGSSFHSLEDDDGFPKQTNMKPDKNAQWCSSVLTVESSVRPNVHG